MPFDDREVLEFVGQKGTSPEEISERFPGFEMQRLIRAGLVEESRTDIAETQAHGNMPPQVALLYMLTDRGAKAVGIDRLRLGGLT